MEKQKQFNDASIQWHIIFASFSQHLIKVKRVQQFAEQLNGILAFIIIILKRDSNEYLIVQLLKQLLCFRIYVVYV